MEYFLAFFVGGVFCMVGQLLLDVWKLSLTHVMSIFVVVGTILAGFGLYDYLIQFAGAGATVPISSFGYSIFIGAMKQAQESNGIGIGMGVFNLTSAGITASILFSFIVALFFKPKG